MKSKDLPPLPDEKLTPQEQRANAHRTNAYLELAKITQQLLNATTGCVQVQVGVPPQSKGDLPGNAIVTIPASAEQLATWVAGTEMRVKQLEIGLNAIVDMLLGSRLVVAVPIEGAPEDASPGLEVSKINREQYWLMCALSAERTASTLRKGLLSAGQGQILRKQ